MDGDLTETIQPANPKPEPEADSVVRASADNDVLTRTATYSIPPVASATTTTLILRAATVLLLAITMRSSATAQVTVTGSVSDAATGESLPAANIRIAGTFTGTISNADGDFRLLVPRIPATIIFRYIGYQSDSVRVTGPSTSPLQIRLQPSVLEMEELLVTDENRAIEIMRRVIARKQRMTSVLERYRVDAYNRFTLANDTGIVSVMETVTEAFWDKEKGSREIVKMERKTSNVDFSGLPAALLVSNLYADNIEVSGYTFVGVTNPRALSVYNFEIEGMRMRDDDLLYDIAVEPKNPTAVAFVGTITVLDRESVMLEAKLAPGPSFRFPPPIRAVSIAMEQQYDVFADSLWLPVDYRSKSTFDFGVANLFEIPTIKVDQVSRLQNYDVNPDFPDSLFANRRQVRMDTLSIRRNPDIPDSLSVPLASVESIAYDTIDSTMTLDKAYKPTGAIAKMVEVRFNMGGDGDGGRRSGGSDSTRRSIRSILNPSIAPIAQFNRVDGFKLGARPKVRVGRVEVDGGVAYSTSLAGDPPNDEPWSTDVGVRVAMRAFAAFRWYDVTSSTFRSASHPQILNTATVLLGGNDYFDYYRLKGTEWKVGYERRDFRGSLAFRRERHDSLMASTSYDILGSHNELRPNAPIVAGNLRSFVASVAINPADAPIAITGSRSLYFDVEAAPDFGGGDFEFASITVRGDWTQETLGRRRLLPAVLDLRVVASTFAGSLPPQRLGVLDVSNFPFSTVGTFRTAQRVPYRGEQTAALFWEHNFRTIPFELVGLKTLADRNYGVTVFGGHGIGRLNGTRFVHHEVGIALTGVLGLLRVDYTKRLDASGYGVGFGLSRLF